MSEPKTDPAPAGRREQVDPRYLPAWDLCRVAHDLCPADHKPVWWACFEAARALGTLGDSNGRTSDPGEALCHLLTARQEADAADLLWDNPAAPTKRTRFGEALEAALDAVRQHLAPSAAPGSGAIEELLSTAQKLDEAGRADLRRRVLEALGGLHEQPGPHAGADPDPLAQARALALVLGFNEMVRTAETLEERILYRLARDAHEDAARELGVKIERAPDPERVIVTLRERPRVELRERDLGLMRAALAAHDGVPPAETSSAAQREAIARLIEAQAEHYPVDIFPADGTRPDDIAAKMARHLCKVLAEQVRALEPPATAAAPEAPTAQEAPAKEQP